METSWLLLELACFFDLNKVYLPTYLPRYFEELSSTPKYFVFIESGTMLLITLVVHSSYWKLSQLFGHLAKSKTSNSNKLPHLHIIGNRSDHSLYYSVPQLTVATIVLLNGEWIIRINLLMSAVSHAGYKGFFLLLGFSVHLMALITAINRCIYKISKVLPICKLGRY